MKNPCIIRGFFVTFVKTNNMAKPILICRVPHITELVIKEFAEKLRKAAPDWNALIVLEDNRNGITFEAFSESNITHIELEELRYQVLHPTKNK